MKKLIFTLSIVLCAFFLKAQDFNHVLVSKKKINNKAAITYVNYGGDFYLTFRDGSRQFDYKLKNLGGHTMGGYTEVSFSATLSTNVLVKGLIFRLSFPDGSVKGQQPPNITFIIDDKETQSFELEGV